MIDLKQILALCLFCISFTLNAQSTTITEHQYQSGGYIVIQTEPNATVEFMNTFYTPDPQGYLAIGFSRDLSGTHEITITLPSGSVDLKKITITPRKYNVQRIEGAPASRVTPPPEVAKRISSEAAQVRKARAIIGDDNFWRIDKFQWPAKGRISGVYGSQRYYNGKPGNPHWGIDIAAPKGDPVYAPAGGKIVLAEDDLYYSGGTIILDHGAGVSSTFLHLSSVDVTVGQYVKKGDYIAAIGSTGLSTGPHLDWRMNLHGVRIDAALWVNE